MLNEDYAWSASTLSPRTVLPGHPFYAINDRRGAEDGSKGPYASYSTDDVHRALWSLLPIVEWYVKEVRLNPRKEESKEYSQGDWVIAAIVGPQQAETELKRVASSNIGELKGGRAEMIRVIVEEYLEPRIRELREPYTAGGAIDKTRVEACVAKVVADLLLGEVVNFQRNLGERPADDPVAVFRDTIRTFVLAHRVVVRKGTAESAWPERGGVTRAGDTCVNPKDGLTYVWIPPGKFTMGCSPEDECFKHEKLTREVTISRGLWIGQTPVTQEAYQKVMGTNPSNFKGAKLPVENITWNDAQAYCQAAGVRLPTEAEWEYAARAGSTGSRYGDVDKIAWYDKNSGGKPHEVGQKLPNAWGLYDMLGNVWEWVADWYLHYYLVGSVSDPRGPIVGNGRVQRGGSWYVNSGLTRASTRVSGGPGVREHGVGLRCAGE